LLAAGNFYAFFAQNSGSKLMYWDDFALCPSPFYVCKTNTYISVKFDALAYIKTFEPVYFD
jgi:hypothetical protein